MKFCNKNKDVVDISVAIEHDGCAVIEANDVGVIRFTESGNISRIINSPSDVEKLMAMGFKIIDGEVVIK